MDLVFGYNNNSNRVNYQQENNIIARKPGLSTRKPFADRKVNENLKQVSPNPTSVSVTKPVKKIKSQEKEILIDKCSFKDVPDNFADIRIEAIENMISSGLFGKAPKTPPPMKQEIIAPDFVKTVKSTEDYEYNSVLDQIRSVGVQGFKNNMCFDDPPMPSLDLLMD